MNWRVLAGQGIGPLRVGASSQRTVRRIVASKRVRSLACRAVLGAALLVAATTGPRAGNFNVFGPQTLTRTEGRPNIFTFTFAATNTTIPYTLRVDDHGVNSAIVTLNGVQIIGPDDCKARNDHDWKKAPDWDDDDWNWEDGRRGDDDEWRRDHNWRGLIERTVHLRRSNVLTVELRSKPGTHLRIMIFGGDNAVYHPDLHGFFRRNGFAGHHHFRRELFADGSRQKEATAAIGR